jgi:hypothetical protein
VSKVLNSPDLFLDIFLGLDSQSFLKALNSSWFYDNPQRFSIATVTLVNILVAPQMFVTKYSSLRTVVAFWILSHQGVLRVAIVP